MNLILAFAGPLVSIAFKFLEYFVFKKARSEESRKIFLQLSKILREAGVTGAQSRFEAEGQLEAGANEWAEREKASAAPTAGETK